MTNEKLSPLEAWKEIKTIIENDDYIEADTLGLDIIETALKEKALKKKEKQALEIIKEIFKLYPITFMVLMRSVPEEKQDLLEKVLL